MRSTKTRLAGVAATAAMTLALAAPAQAQQQGLVNVDIDITNNEVLVQVPIGVAANVCPNVNAAVIAQDFRQTGDAVCEADVTQLPRAFQ